MILRRFMQHVKDQNWFAVSLDVLVVIVGIFLGMQVTDWNEERQRAAYGNAFLGRLHDDISYDIAKMEQLQKFWRQVYDYGEVAINWVENPKEPVKSNWHIVLAYYQASQMAPFEATRITYNELQAAGQLYLIRNQSLRADLSRYYNFNRSMDAEELLRHIPKYRLHVRGVMPWAVTKYVWKACHFGDDMFNQKLINCPSPISEQEALIILQNLAKNEQLTQQLRAWISNLKVAQDLLNDNYRAAKTLLERVTTEISIQKGTQ